MSNQNNRKNVLLISVDQWPAKRLGVNGDTVMMTPTIDYLADSGLNFTNVYSECPICIPARRTMMTGLSPRSHGDRIYLDTLPMPDAPTLAGCFSRAGYQTYAVGKLHVYPQRNRIGFDDALIVEEGRNEFGVFDDYQIELGELGYISDEFSHAMGNNTYYTRPWHLPERMHPTQWVTRMMMRTIKRSDPTRPGFFYASYPAPHTPLLPLQQYLDMYAEAEFAEDGIREDWSDRDEYIFKTLTESSRRYSKKEILLAKRAYYACCTQIDHQIRLLIGTLRECNMLDNTILAFVGDHGDMLFDHHMVGKRVFYEGSAHVPFIISGAPMQEYRGRCDTGKLATLADLMPTLLALCGLEIPDSVEGIPLCSSARHEMVFGEITEGTRATRMAHDGRYKLIYYPCGNIVQLFDIQKDKMEQHDLAGVPEYASVQEKLTDFLIRHLHGGDERFAANGDLIGFEAPEYTPQVDFGMHNQRGTHWPPPGSYSNYGNTQK